ncbi:MAG: hypothetical protein Q9212_002167 [Teloschistes hypoglaucus]
MSNPVPTTATTNPTAPFPQDIYIITELLVVTSPTPHPQIECCGIFSNRHHAISWAERMMNPHLISWAARPKQFSVQAMASSKEWYSAAIREDAMLVAVSVDRYPLSSTYLGYCAPAGGQREPDLFFATNDTPARPA